MRRANHVNILNGFVVFHFSLEKITINEIKNQLEIGKVCVFQKTE